jgi:enamine deaminase RidA (YjgF/YER057c/UK114 family)
MTTKLSPDTSALKVAEFSHARFRELQITAGTVAEVRRAARKAGAKIVIMNVWGDRTVDGRAYPVTGLLAGASRDAALTGAQALAIQGVPVERILVDGRFVGSVYDDGQARHCYLADLWAADNRLSRAEQAQATFALMDTALRQVGMSFTNVARTWFYLDRLLEWYDEFNRVRNQFFRAHRVYDRLVPASTGISAANVVGRALIANAYAIAPHDSQVKVTAVASPLQCPALQYGSSFSRAVEVSLADRRILSISGTASISPDGKTAHPGDVRAQIDLTMRVVAAILESRGMSWRNVASSLAYFRHAADAPVFRDWLAAHDLADLPALLTENDICRDDLLFEFEAAAVQPVG